MNDRQVKQVIVIRKDLKMPTGKACAQASHASMGALLTLFEKRKMLDDSTEYKMVFEEDSVLDKWLNGIFTKACLRVDSEEELQQLYKDITTYNETAERKIPVAYIEDCGLTCFNGKKTATCMGIGPAYNEDIDKFTKDLKLFY